MAPDTYSSLPHGTTWLFAGDSITQGIYHTHGARSWVELVHEYLRWRLDRPRDLVINSGVTRWTVTDLLGDFEHMITRFAPDVVSLSLGTNDAMDGDTGLPAFREGLDELIQRSLALGARVVVHTPVLTTPDAPAARRATLPDYAQVVRELAAEHDLTLVDHEKKWQEQFGDDEPTPWMDNHTHPNAVGHIAMAQETLRVLGLGEMKLPL